MATRACLLSTHAPKTLWGGRIQRSTADEAYANFQSNYVTGEDGNRKNCDIQTKADSQMEASKNLFATAARFRDAVGVMENICDELNDPNISRTRIREKARQLQKYIIPLISHASATIDDTAQVLAPIARLKYVHDRNEVARKKAVANTILSNATSEKEHLIYEHIQKEEERKKKNGRSLIDEKCTPTAKKPRRNPNRVTHPNDLSSDNVITISFPDTEEFIEVTVTRLKSHEEVKVFLPAPGGGKEYCKEEVIDITDETVERSHERGIVIRALIAHQSRFNIPLTARTIRRYMEQRSKLIPMIHKEWLGVGQPPICNDINMAKIAQHCEHYLGKSYCKSNMKQMLEDKHTKKLKNAGSIKILENSISQSSVRNYTALLADQPNMSVSQSTTTKSNTRHGAENSIRGSISTLSLIAYTHFVPVDRQDPDLRQELKSLPNSVQMLSEMVSEAWGCPVHPVHPALIFSTDDTTEYIFEGTKNTPHNFVLTTKSSIQKRGTNAVYNTEDNKSMNGMRVKLTFTFSAMGTSMPLVVTVTGLTEKEMPDGKEFIHVKVPGMCIGGGGVSAKNQSYGHLLLMRNTEGAEKRRFTWYQENILMKGTSINCKVYCGFDDSSRREIPDRLTAVSWSDGDLSQIAAIKGCIDQLLENKIIANK